MFVVIDEYSKVKGYLYNDPHNGWGFTKFLSSAQRFPTFGDAQKAINEHFPRLARYLKVGTVSK